MREFNSCLIIEQMKKVLGKESDKALADVLGVTPTTFSAWKKRNNLPISVVLEFSETHNLSLDWLILDKEMPKFDEMTQGLLNRFQLLDFEGKLAVLNAVNGKDGRAVSQTTVDQSNNFGGMNNYVTGEFLK